MFKKLFTPIALGPLSLANRIVMPPMTTRYGNPDGSVSPRIREYYAARARGGAGLIIVEMACVTQDERSMPCQLALWSDELVPGFKALVDAVHSGGSPVFLQLQHSGREAIKGDADGAAVAPSPIRGGRGVPRELTPGEIGPLVQDFAAAAVRAKAAGFDGIELHAAHIYLIHQFLSPLSNHREDEYGGSVEGRARFALEVLTEARKRVGREFPISFRINGSDFREGGITLDQAARIACLLEEAGATCIHVSGGTVGTIHMSTAGATQAPGFLVPLAAGIKKAVSLPVITVGRITDPLLAEQVLMEGKADLVAMGRALIADPELPNKARAGRLEDVRRCIACCNCMRPVEGPVCTVNPAAGKEAQSAVLPAQKARKVVVVGGGPGGLEAARVAASRGHQVTLYERAEKLGGQLNLAAVPPHKQEVSHFTDYLVSQVGKLGVKVVLGEEATPEALRRAGAEAVIIAAGSRPKGLNIPGAKGSHVVDAWAVVSGAATTGDRVVVIGGGQVGCETALLLRSQGKQVTTVEMLPELLVGLEPPRVRSDLLWQLKQAGVVVRTGWKAEEITREGVVMATPEGKRALEADSIVIAAGALPNNGLAQALDGGPFELHVIGDAAQPRRIADAVREGFEVGRAV
ncbi:MAG: FAD-dependent oxidoreductase [Chloroflexi bacterium]|nr:FAD-dependent oxidoreductase [Chloroflexota bacterium]